MVSCLKNPEVGQNINGPSLIRVPAWLENPLGRYYLYFGHHKGTCIRLAYADTLKGPWTVYEPGTLCLEQTGCMDHIASPDVHVDQTNKRLVMYFHGPVRDMATQQTRVAISSDGLRFGVLDENLGLPYFRVFRHDGWYYALAMSVESSTVIYRSSNGLSGFQRGPAPFVPNMRHSAVLRREDLLYVFYTVVGDSPEHIKYSTIEMSPDWMTWKPTRPRSLLKPEKDWEGAKLPRKPSRYGRAKEPVRQLRDPGIYEEDGEIYLLYSTAGEQGIALVRILLGE